MIRPTAAHKATLVLLLTLTVATSAPAQTPATKTDDHAEAIAFARDLVGAVMKQSGIPGMSVAVGIDGKLVWAEGFGYADLEHKIPVWQETRFRIGSVSKPVTAFAVGLLMEQGKLDVDAPVQTYVPDFPEKPWPVSTRQAAGHTAGFRHYRGNEFLSSEYYATVTDGLAIFKDDDLLFEPGTGYAYSSYGWNLVSAVVEGAADEPFLEYMQREVFDRLGMTHTTADVNTRIIPHRTRFYTKNQDGSITNGPYVDNSYKWAGGGFLSTPSDLVAFGFAHFDDDYLDTETRNELWTSLRTTDGEETGYGIGWGVEVEDGQVTRAGHGGGSIGGTTGFATYPQQRAVVAVTGNMTGGPVGGLLPHLIMQAFLDGQPTSTDGPDLAGTYTCTVGEGDGASPMPLVLLGETGSYWGRADDIPIVRVWTDASGARIVVPNRRGAIADVRFDEIDDTSLQGQTEGSERPIACERQTDG